MKLAILSDLHIDICPYEMPDIFDDVDFIIDAGDLCESDKTRERWLLSMDKPFCYIAGNHDLYGKVFPAPETHVKKIRYGELTIAAATLWTDLSNPLDWIRYTQGLIDYRSY